MVRYTVLLNHFMLNYCDTILIIFRIDINKIYDLRSFISRLRALERCINLHSKFNAFYVKGENCPIRVGHLEKSVIIKHVFFLRANQNLPHEIPYNNST